MLGLRISSNEMLGDDGNSDEKHLRILIKRMLECQQTLQEKIKHYESVLHMSRDCFEICGNVSINISYWHNMSFILVYTLRNNFLACPLFEKLLKNGASLFCTFLANFEHYDPIGHISLQQTSIKESDVF